MIYYVVNTTAETVTILDMFPTKEGADRYTDLMQPWFTHPLQVVRSAEQQHDMG